VIKKRELSDLNPDSANIKLTECLEKLDKLRFQQSMQQVENPLQIKMLKKQIAQLKTILNEFNLGLRGDIVTNE
tara:strand:- start:540 stop:761 length:222 start_codon:yes stop_codon:yes gene_type:complete